MLTTPIELAAVSAHPDQDAEVLGVYSAGAYLAMTAGAFGLAMATFEDLSPRQRRLALAASLATCALGVLDVLEPVEFAAVLRRRLSPWALPAFGLCALAVSGAERSPMFYPSLILTGFGCGRLGRARLVDGKPTPSAVLGACASAAYMASVIGVGRLKKQPLQRRLLWNLGAAPLHFAAAAIGGELGDLALAVRRVERTRTRDTHALEPAAPVATAPVATADMATLAEEVSHTALAIEQTLLRIAAPLRNRPDPSSREVRAAVKEVREDIQHHQLAPLLVAAANETPLPLAATIEAMLAVYREGWRDEVTILFHADIPAARAIQPRVTSALLRAAKVALDNAHAHQRRPLRTVELTLTANSSHHLELRVRDDGGGSPPRTGDWKTGLSETHAHVRSLDGHMRLLATPQGVELRLTVPTQPPASQHLHLHAQLADRIDASLLRCAKIIRPATWLNGLTCCLTAPNRRSRIAHATLFTALVLADRAHNGRRPRDPRRPLLTVPAVSLLWPSGGRPTTGWAGLEAVSLAAFGRARESLHAGLLAFACTSLSALRVRRTVATARLVENLAFPLVCGVSGLGAAHYGRRLLEAAEQASLGLRERAELIEQLARAVRLHHDLIKPLRHSHAWYGEGIMASADGQYLLRLSGRIDRLTRELLALIAVADPIADLHEHLQLRLAPTAVTVGGTRPLWTSQHARAVAVQRAREHLALVAFADELADHVLARFPPTIAGHPRIECLHLDISPLDDRYMRVSLQPLPADTHPERRCAELEAAVSRLSGHIMQRRPHDSLTLALPATALATL